MEVPQKRRVIKWSRFVGQWGFTRFLRWAIFFVICNWIISNCHQNLPLETLRQRYASPNSTWVSVEDLDVHCQITGKGTPLLLLHDEGSSLQTWAAWSDSLSKHYQVISVDLPGFGLTGPHPRGSYSSFMYASFLEHLTDTLHLKKFHLAGVGLGGQIAWFYASEHPERVEKLVLMGASGYENAGMSAITLLARTPVINSVMWTITPRYFFQLMLEEMYADDRLVTDSLIQRHFELALRPGNRRAFTDRAAVRDNRPPVDFVEQITTPTLILWGAEDAVISPQHAYDFHRRIRGALLKIYQNTGHWPQEENPGQTATDVRAFLEGKF